MVPYILMYISVNWSQSVLIKHEENIQYYPKEDCTN